MISAISKPMETYAYGNGYSSIQVDLFCDVFLLYLLEFLFSLVYTLEYMIKTKMSVPMRNCYQHLYSYYLFQVNDDYLFFLKWPSTFKKQ